MKEKCFKLLPIETCDSYGYKLYFPTKETPYSITFLKSEMIDGIMYFNVDEEWLIKACDIKKESYQIRLIKFLIRILEKFIT